jgi:hypothetical protein
MKETTLNDIGAFFVGLAAMLYLPELLHIDFGGTLLQSALLASYLCLALTGLWQFAILKLFDARGRFVCAAAGVMAVLLAALTALPLLFITFIMAAGSVGPNQRIDPVAFYDGLVTTYSHFLYQSPHYAFDGFFYDLRYVTDRSNGSIMMFAAVIVGISLVAGINFGGLYREFIHQPRTKKPAPILWKWM